MAWYDFLTGKTEPTNPTVSSGTTAGGSSDFSSSESQSTSFSDPSTVWGPQAEYLTDLYGGAQGLAQNAGAQQQGAQGVYNTALNGFNSMMSPGVNPQLDAYSGAVQRNLERNLLPTIQGNAGGFGQMGGARQGVAEGLALSDSNQQITDMASNLYGQDRDRQLQAMNMAPQLGTFGMSIPWYAQQQYGGLLGAPTTLQGARGSQSTGMSSGGGSSWSTGETTSTGGGGGGGYPGLISIDL